MHFKFSPEELEQRYKSHEIDKMIEKDKHAMKRQVKLLLLGAGESGKSTFLKQMRIIHGIKFESPLVNEYRLVIYENLVKGMKVLADARQKLDIPWGDNNNGDLGRDLLLFDNNLVLDTRTFSRFSPLLARLWKDSGIRRTFERRREFQLVSQTHFGVMFWTRNAALNSGSHDPPRFILQHIRILDINLATYYIIYNN